MEVTDKVSEKPVPTSKGKAGSGASDGKWQAEKSQLTRNAIMVAAMQCFINYGYSNTTIEKIAKEAKVSRGALSHHFSSRDDVIKASIKFVTLKRAEECEFYIQKLQEIEATKVVNKHSIKLTLDELWNYFHIPSYSAMLELLMAARGHPELDEIIAPSLEILDSRIKRAIHDAFPAWNDIENTRQAVTDLIFYSLQGLALSRVTRRDEPRVQAVLDLLTRGVVREYELTSREHKDT